MRYHLDVVLRSASDPKGPTRMLGCRVTASDEETARRMVLARAWQQGLIVSRFVMVHTR